MPQRPVRKAAFEAPYTLPGGLVRDDGGEEEVGEADDLCVAHVCGWVDVDECDVKGTIAPFPETLLDLVKDLRNSNRSTARHDYNHCTSTAAAAAGGSIVP